MNLSITELAKSRPRQHSDHKRQQFLQTVNSFSQRTFQKSQQKEVYESNPLKYKTNLFNQKQQGFSDNLFQQFDQILRPHSTLGPMIEKPVLLREEIKKQISQRQQEEPSDNQLRIESMKKDLWSFISPQNQEEIHEIQQNLQKQEHQSFSQQEKPLFKKNSKDMREQRESMEMQENNYNYQEKTPMMNLSLQMKNSMKASSLLEQFKQERKVIERVKPNDVMFNKFEEMNKKNKILMQDHQDFEIESRFDNLRKLSDELQKVNENYNTYKDTHSFEAKISLQNSRKVSNNIEINQNQQNEHDLQQENQQKLDTFITRLQGLYNKVMMKMVYQKVVQMNEKMKVFQSYKYKESSFQHKNLQYAFLQILETRNKVQSEISQKLNLKSVRLFSNLQYSRVTPIDPKESQDATINLENTSDIYEKTDNKESLQVSIQPKIEFESIPDHKCENLEELKSQLKKEINPQRKQKETHTFEDLKQLKAKQSRQRSHTFNSFLDTLGHKLQ